MSSGGSAGPRVVLIVAGHLEVDPMARGAYLDDCAEVVRQARRADGCLDFALTADLLDPGRIVVYERWESDAQLRAFRGSGPSDEQQLQILSASVREYRVTPTD